MKPSSDTIAAMMVFAMSTLRIGIRGDCPMIEAIEHVGMATPGPTARCGRVTAFLAHARRSARDLQIPLWCARAAPAAREAGLSSEAAALDHGARKSRTIGATASGLGLWV